MVLSTCTNTPNDTDYDGQSRQQVQITHLPCSQTASADDNVCFQNAASLETAESGHVLSLKSEIARLKSINNELLLEKSELNKIDRSP